MLGRARRAAFVVLFSSLLATAIVGAVSAFLVGRSVLVDDLDHRLDRELERAQTLDEVPVAQLASTGRVRFRADAVTSSEANGPLGSIAQEAAVRGALVEGTRVVAGQQSRVRAVPRPAGGGDVVVAVAVVASRDGATDSLARRLALTQVGIALVTSVVAAWAARRSTRILESLFRQEDRLMRAVAHEVRSPLSSALAAVDEGLAGVSEPREALGEAGVHLEGADELIEDLLEAARVMSGASVPTREVVQLDEVAASAVDSVAVGLCEVVLDLEPAQVVGSRRLLRRAVSNLVRNAVIHAYASGPGRIVVRVDRRGVEVLDDGPGVPVEDLDQLRFESPLAANEQGPGLGLTIGGWVAEIHGGHLALENRSGGGFRSALELPMMAEPSESPTSTGSDEHQGAPSSVRVPPV